MIKNPQKVNSNIFGNKELSKEEHERIKNEKINPLDRYIIAIPEFVYQGTQYFVQSTEQEFLDFKKDTKNRTKLLRDKKVLNNVINYFKAQYLNKEIDLQQALKNIKENQEDFFSSQIHIDFYRNQAHFRSYIEEYFNQ